MGKPVTEQAGRHANSRANLADYYREGFIVAHRTNATDCLRLHHWNFVSALVDEAWLMRSEDILLERQVTGKAQFE